jgi:hypothetical protein
MKMSPLGDHVVEGDDRVAFHGRLQGADRVDFGDDDLGPEAAHGLDAAFADVSIAADDDFLARDHDPGGPLDPVGQRFAAAVEVVELGLGHGVVDVDRGEEQGPLGLHLIEAVDAGRRFLRDASDPGGRGRPTPGGAADGLFQPVDDDPEFPVVVRPVKQGGILFDLDPPVDEQRRVASVVDDEVRTGAVGPGQGLFRAPPVLLQGFAFPSEDGRRSGLGHGRRGVILGRKNVA